MNVGYDGSTPSAEAVMWAADEAATVRAHVRIVSCYDIPLVGDATYGWNTTEGDLSAAWKPSSSNSARSPEQSPTITLGWTSRRRRQPGRRLACLWAALDRKTLSWSAQAAGKGPQPSGSGAPLAW